MSGAALAIAAAALLAVAGFMWDTVRHRRRAEQAAQESKGSADTARAVDRRIKAELDEALADAHLVRGLAIRCYPTDEPGDTVTLGPVHYLPSDDGSTHHWYIHVLVPQQTSYLLAEATSIWRQEARPTAALLNFLVPPMLNAPAAAATAASAVEGDR